MAKHKIKNIEAREILDSRGIPTIEVCVTLKNGVTGVSAVPSGASTGIYEAHELRDGDKRRYFGKGVLTAVNNVNGKIKSLLLNKDAGEQLQIDALLLALDGTQNKTYLGANAILATSLACCRAVANSKKLPLYVYLNSLIGGSMQLPVPMCNILNGGAHASNNLDIQEFMIMPVGATSFSEGIRWCSEIFNSLKKLLKQKGLSIAVGDEGGFAPNLESTEQALDLILEAIEKAGYNTKDQIKLSIDAAVSEWKTETGYALPKAKTVYTDDELINYWVNLVKKYPILSLEDPLGETDYLGFTKITEKLGKSVQIVGDDLFVTNKKMLKTGILEKQANSILIKVNQIGSLTETLQTIALAKEAGFTTVISHRSGETEDTFIADLAVATSTQIKTGSLSRSERVAKYNRLLKIEQEQQGKLNYCGKNAFYSINKN
ncbi:MAG: phosphopyruvate hydratase [Tenericutes bacterium HGW-Tenericutes-4]|jgi:enolase|nr:MAG: phosphopyruvate hydratase [Tenericutes bacterium HGW-Tenericutes-4]